MNMNTIVASLAVTAGLVAHAASSSNPMDAVSTVKPGAWTSSFTAAKEYADANNVPMLVFWANPGCSQCAKLETACKSDAFKAWMSEMKLVFVFGYGTTTDDTKACKEFAKNSSKAFPYLATYWKSNTAGKNVLEKFTGRSGAMTAYGATKKQDLDDQLMTAVNTILSDWDSNGGSVTPDPDPTPVIDTIDVSEVYKKTLSYSAVISDDEGYVGTATLKIGRINSRKGTVKVSVSGSLFTGKRISSSATVTPEEDGSLEGSFRLASSLGGAMDFVLDYDSETESFAFEAENDQYTIAMGEVQLGGAFETDELSFTVSIDDMELPENYDFVVDVPSGAPVYVKNGTKLSCDKSASIKYKKVDGEWVLTGADDENRPNVSGLKISYAAKTGVFKGTFTIYASNDGATEKKPTLKKYKASFSGLVIDGSGVGVVTIKVGKTAYSGTCTLE
jgi:hypothetical protein